MIGLISAPGTAAEIGSHFAEDLRRELSLHLPSVRWRVPKVVDDLVLPPANDAVLVAAARDRLLKTDWDLVVFLTDLPYIHHAPAVFADNGEVSNEETATFLRNYMTRVPRPCEAGPDRPPPRSRPSASGLTSAGVALVAVPPAR